MCHRRHRHRRLCCSQVLSTPTARYLYKYRHKRKIRATLTSAALAASVVNHQNDGDTFLPCAQTAVFFEHFSVWAASSSASLCKNEYFCVFPAFRAFEESGVFPTSFFLFTRISLPAHSGVWPSSAKNFRIVYSVNNGALRGRRLPRGF